MYVLVTNTSVEVREADDCTSLGVRIKASNSKALATAGLGEWNGQAEIDLDVTALHRLASTAATMPDWEQSWTAMLAYAERKGWLAPDGTTVRAHVVGETV